MNDHSALVGFTGVLVGAGVSAAANFSIAKSNRRAMGQVEALCVVQERVSALRTQFRSWGRETVHTQESSDELAAALDLLRVALTRVRCSVVREKVESWRQVAQWYWDGEPGSAARETELWDDAMGAIQKDLILYG